jgi:hypothetical protein
MLGAVVIIFSIYAPVSFGRKMIEGIHLPLCLLAAAGVFELLKNLKAPLQLGFAIACGALLCLSSLQFIAWCIADAPKSIVPYRGAMPPLYLSEYDDSALRFLQRQHAKDEAQNKPPAAVLSLSFIGNYIPQKTGFHAYLGHWAETLNYNRKSGEAAAFYKGELTRSKALNWLRKNHIRYVFFGFYENGVFGSSSPMATLLGAPIDTEGPDATHASNNPPAFVYEVPDK